MSCNLFYLSTTANPIVKVPHGRQEMNKGGEKLDRLATIATLQQYPESEVVAACSEDPERPLHLSTNRARIYETLGLCLRCRAQLMCSSCGCACQASSKHVCPPLPSPT
jgi:hypothetical protein